MYKSRISSQYSDFFPNKLFQSLQRIRFLLLAFQNYKSMTPHSRKYKCKYKNSSSNYFVEKLEKGRSIYFAFNKYLLQKVKDDIVFNRQLLVFLHRHEIFANGSLATKNQLILIANIVTNTETVEDMRIGYILFLFLFFNPPFFNLEV